MVMELLLLTVIICLLLAVQTLVIRYYLRQLISRLTEEDRSTPSPKQASTTPVDNKGFLGYKDRLFKGNQVISEPNELDDESSDSLEFSEDSPMDIPKDVKFDVEGGDMGAPFGFETETK